MIVVPQGIRRAGIRRLQQYQFTPKERRKLTVGLLFISPWLFGFLAFTLYPLLYTLAISFTRYTGLNEPLWVGLGNYQRMFHDDLFWKSLYNTTYYTALAVPLGIVIALLMALAMNQPLREVVLYRAALYLPSVLPIFALSFIFLWLLHPQLGLVNRAMMALGLPSPNWFGDPKWAKFSLVMLAQMGAGGTALVFLAGLKAIPQELYDAAEVDGANAWRKFWNITWPLLTPVILYYVILGISSGMQVFAQSFIITQGGPSYATLFYVYYLYNNAFGFSQMGYAAALSWVLFAISFALALAVFRLSSNWVHYEIS